MFSVEIFKCQESETVTCPDDMDDYFDDKEIALLINNRHSDFGHDFRDP